MATKHIDFAGRFVVAAIQDPKGYRPGLYYYVMHLATGNKVSRYLRRPGSAYRKLVRYAGMWEAGDHHWPAVTRCDELRDSKDAVWTIGEVTLVVLGLRQCE
jgi:hypothetical protein